MVTWRALFDCAADHGATEREVRAALAARRDGDRDGGAGDGNGEDADGDGDVAGDDGRP